MKRTYLVLLAAIVLGVLFMCMHGPIKKDNGPVKRHAVSVTESNVVLEGQAEISFPKRD